MFVGDKNRKPAFWALTPGLVDPIWNWFWGPTLSSAGIIWAGGGNPYDFVSKKFTTLISAAEWKADHRGLAIELNDASRNGETIELTGRSGMLDGLTTFTYAIYFRWIGSASGNEDSLGIHWSDMQGVFASKRILVRYDSNNKQLDFFTHTGVDQGFAASADLSDALPHTCVFRYDIGTANKTIWLDGIKIGSTTQSGALTSTADARHPEVFGGHLVTQGVSDSPRIEGYSWVFDERPWTDAEIVQWSRDPFGPFRMLDEVGVVVVPAVGGISDFRFRQRYFG